MRHAGQSLAWLRPGCPRRQDEKRLQRFEEHAVGRSGVDILPALAECRTELNTAELNVRVRESWPKVIATSVILNPRAGSNNCANCRLHFANDGWIVSKTFGRTCSNRRGSLVNANCTVGSPRLKWTRCRSRVSRLRMHARNDDRCIPCSQRIRKVRPG
jgi:hypothetical protein